MPRVEASEGLCFSLDRVCHERLRLTYLGSYCKRRRTSSALLTPVTALVDAATLSLSFTGRPRGRGSESHASAPSLAANPTCWDCVQRRRLWRPSWSLTAPMGPRFVGAVASVL